MSVLGKRYAKLEEGAGGSGENQSIIQNNLASDFKPIDGTEFGTREDVNDDNVLTAEDLALNRVKNVKTRKPMFQKPSKRRSKWICMSCCCIIFCILLAVIIAVAARKGGKSKGFQTLSGQFFKDSVFGSFDKPAPKLKVLGPEDLDGVSTKLPTQPVMYDLRLDFSENNFNPDKMDTTLDGHLKLLVYIDQDVNEFVLHSQQLNIKEAFIKYAGDGLSKEEQDDIAEASSKVLTDSQLTSAVKEYQDPTIGEVIPFQVPQYLPLSSEKLLFELDSKGIKQSVETKQNEVYGLTLFDLGDFLLAKNSFILVDIKYEAQIRSESQASGLFYMIVEDGIDGTNVQASDDAKPGIILSTDLGSQSTGALLPCLDVPHMKALVRMTVGVPQSIFDSHEVLTNTKVSKIDNEGDNRVVYEYNTSPPMSIDNVALVIGELESVEVDQKYEVQNNVTAYARPNESDFEELPVVYAYQAAVYYARYTGVQQNDAMDFKLVVLPRRSSSTDSWGLVILDEDRFLLEPSRADSRDVYRLLSVVCHQIGLQWFGNLVSMRLKTDTAFTHGLVSSLETGCIESLSGGRLPSTVLKQMAPSPLLERAGPHEGIIMQAMHLAASPYARPLKYNLNDQMLVDLDFDGDSHPVSLQLVHFGIVDRVATAVGGSFWNYLEGIIDLYVQEGTFKQAVATLASEFPNQSLSMEQAVAGILQAAVAGDKDKVEEIDSMLAYLLKWVASSGYPVLKIDPLTRGDYKNGKIVDMQFNMTQHRFCLDATEDKDNTDDLVCADKSPFHLAYTQGLPVDAEDEVARWMLLNIQALWGSPDTIYQNMRKFQVDSNNAKLGWVSVSEKSQQQSVTVAPVDEEELTDGYQFIERKGSVRPLHVSVYPQVEYNNLAERFGNILNGLDKVLDEFKKQLKKKEAELNAGTFDSVDNEAVLEINKEATDVLNDLMDIYVTVRDLLVISQSMFADVSVVNDDDCDAKGNCWSPASQVISMLKIDNMLTNSKHGVPQFVMGRLLSQVIQIYAAPLSLQDEQCGQIFEQQVWSLLEEFTVTLFNQLIEEDAVGLTSVILQFAQQEGKEELADPIPPNALIGDSNVFFKKLILAEMMTLAHLYNVEPAIEKFGEQAYTYFSTGISAVNSKANQANLRVDVDKYPYWAHLLIHPDLQAGMYMCALHGIEQCQTMMQVKKDSDESVFHQLFSYALIEPDKAIRHRTMSALMTTNDVDEGVNLLKYIYHLDDNPIFKVQKQQFPVLPAHRLDLTVLAARNVALRQPTLDFIADNLSELVEQTGKTFMMDMLVEVLGATHPERQYLQDRFMSALEEAEFSEYHLEMLRTRVWSRDDWRSNSIEPICTWLKSS